jgi:hypothetical protein
MGTPAMFAAEMAVKTGLQFQSQEVFRVHIAGWSPASSKEELDAAVAAHFVPAAQTAAIAVVPQEPEPPKWTAPTHEEINLAKVEPEDFTVDGVPLDPFDVSNPLVKAIYQAQTRDGNIPAELKAKPNWVRWQLEPVNGRLTKVPYQLSGNKASSTDQTTWTTYENIATGAVVNETQGVGIMTDGTFIGFDLDG